MLAADLGTPGEAVESARGAGSADEGVVEGRPSLKARATLHASPEHKAAPERISVFIVIHAPH